MSTTMNSQQKFDFMNSMIDNSVKTFGDFEEGTTKLKRIVEQIKLASIDKSFNATVGFLKNLDDFYAELGASIKKIAEGWSEDTVHGAGFVASANELLDSVKKLNIGVTVKEVALSSGLDENYDDASGKSIVNSILELLQIKHQYILKIAGEVEANATPDMLAVMTLLGGATEKVNNSWVDIYESWKNALKALNINLEAAEASAKGKAAGLDSSADSRSTKNYDVSPKGM